MSFLNMKYIASGLTLVLFSQTLFAQPTSLPWPVSEKKAAIAGCRLNIIEHTEQDYLKRHNLQALPANFRKRTAHLVEPALAVCDCAIDQVEKRWSYEYFLTHLSEMPLVMKEIMTQGYCPLPQLAE